MPLAGLTALVAKVADDVAEDPRSVMDDSGSHGGRSDDSSRHGGGDD